MQEPVLSYRSQITTLSREASRHHLLDLDDFTRDELEMVFSTTDAMKDVLSRDVGRVPTLRGKSVVTLFYEASTRTRVSFELAAKALSADTISVASATSSVAKGESLVDTVRTIAAMGVDAIILRHPMSGAPYLAARHTQASVINAGDGAHAHPTQALLDLYTIKSRLGRLEGIKVVIVGDVLHSRVARSNLWGLNLAGARVVVSGPPTLLPRNWTSTASYDEGEASAQALPPVAIEPNLEVALTDADVVMTLRLQSERQSGALLPSLREYARLYQINSQRLAKAKPDVLVMHPGPMNEGVEIAPDVAHGAQSVIEEQVTNGVSLRMAVLYLLMGGGR